MHLDKVKKFFATAFLSTIVFCMCPASPVLAGAETGAGIKVGTGTQVVQDLHEDGQMIGSEGSIQIVSEDGAETGTGEMADTPAEPATDVASDMEKDDGTGYDGTDRMPGIPACV